VGDSSGVAVRAGVRVGDSCLGNVRVGEDVRVGTEGVQAEMKRRILVRRMCTLLWNIEGSLSDLKRVYL